MSLTRAAELATIASFLFSIAVAVWQFWPKGFKLNGWTIALITVLIVNAVLSSLVLLGRREKPWGGEPLIAVSGQTFRNERVPLDGFHYQGCTFINVALEYRGTAPFALAHNTFEGAPTIIAPPEQTAVAKLALELQRQAGGVPITID